MQFNCTTIDMDDLHEFLEIVEGDESFTTRRFDLILHTHPSFLDFTQAEKLAYHKRKQEDILALAEGFEHELFNDPQVKYPFRSHFNGVAGTMSNILTSCYFTLYAELLEGDFGIQVNALDDLKTIFALASSFPVRNGYFRMDEEELSSVDRIVKHLWRRLNEPALQYTRGWFADYRTFLQTIHADALQSYPFYQHNPAQRTLDQVVNWKVSRATPEQKDEWRRRGFLPSYTHDHYEYYPPYVNPQWRFQLLEEYLERLPLLEMLFNPPFSRTENRPFALEAPLSQKS